MLLCWYFFFLLSVRVACVVVFFFQAEDGIRDADVTGVQTCALPISLRRRPACRGAALYRPDARRGARGNGAVLDGDRNGRAARSGRRLRRGAPAESWPLDERDQADLRGAASRCGELDRFARDPGRRSDARVGGPAGRIWSVPGRA